MTTPALVFLAAAIVVTVEGFEGGSSATAAERAQRTPASAPSRSRSRVSYVLGFEKGTRGARPLLGPEKITRTTTQKKVGAAAGRVALPARSGSHGVYVSRTISRSGRYRCSFWSGGPLPPCAA